MANIKWKGATWEAYRGNFSIPELLTVLKGYGPMEILTFEVPDRFKGQMSLYLADGGTKEITLYDLEVCCEKRHGMGREALKWLRETFRGLIFLEFPDLPDSELGFHPSMPFWFQMYREGFIDTIFCENFYLDPGATSEEVEAVHGRVVSALLKGQKDAGL